MAPPDPFPNSEVKHRCANGSVVRPCESRSSSALYSKKESSLIGWLFFLSFIPSDLHSKSYLKVSKE
jgi:hypothetical protein